MTDGSVKFDKFETASSLPSSEYEAEYDPETNKAAVTNSKSVIRRNSTLYLERDGLTLEFDNIVLSTRSKNHEKNPPKQILKGVSSHFPAATLTAIMGASGSGKTSLLKCLIGRVGKNLDLGGEIRLDGDVVDPTDIDIRREFAYVEQEVSIPATCTPREAIRFSARLRLDKSKTDEDIDLIVNDILDSLGLNKCADTLIGGGPLMSGGLSGGEKKRVQCGVELVTNPRCIVLDGKLGIILFLPYPLFTLSPFAHISCPNLFYFYVEPTSGLDSYTAESLMDVLKNIAKAGATVIVVIHQPPPPVVRKIDNLLLLVQGEKLYDGPLGKPLEDRFNECGYPKPADYNIADWILQVTQVYTVEELKTAGFFVEKSKANQVDNTKAPKKKNQATVVTQQVGFMIQTRYLFDREFKNLVRDKLAIIVRVGSTFTFGLLFGLIFLGVGRSDYVMYTEVQASFGAMANLLISTMFGVAQSSLMEFPKDRPVFLREYSTNHYSILPYFLSKCE